MTVTDTAGAAGIDALGPPAALPEDRGLPSWVGGTIGGVLLIVLWEVLALTVFHGRGSGVPTPTSVVTQFWRDWRAGAYGANVGQTMKEAATGYVVANAMAVVLALAFVQVPLVEKALLRIAIASYCLPILAVGPILDIALSGDRPKSVLAGLLVFFPSLVVLVVGLRSADRTSLEVVRAAGGSSWTQLGKVRLRAALPSLFTALQIAAPSAILGAIIGEYIGDASKGLGVMMILSEQGFRVARTWGIALFCTVIASGLYALTGLLRRFVTPWAEEAGAQ